VGYGSDEIQAQVKLLLFSEADLVNHLNPQLNKSVDYTDLCDHRYPSCLLCNILPVSMDIICLQVLYLVSVLCEKEI